MSDAKAILAELLGSFVFLFGGGLVIFASGGELVVIATFVAMILRFTTSEEFGREP